MGFYTAPNRYICSVFDEMRECYKTYNFGAIASLIEEAQVLANRMESALNDKNDAEEYHKECSIKRKEYNSLCREVDLLKAEVEELEKKKNILKGEQNG